MSALFDQTAPNRLTRLFELLLEIGGLPRMRPDQAVVGRRAPANRRDQ